MIIICSLTKSWYLQSTLNQIIYNDVPESRTFWNPRLIHRQDYCLIFTTLFIFKIDAKDITFSTFIDAEIVKSCNAHEYFPNFFQACVKWLM